MCKEGDIKVWTIPGGNLLRTLSNKRSDGTTRGLVFTPDGKVEIRKVPDSAKENVSLVFSRKGNVLVSVHNHDTKQWAKVWDWRKGAMLMTVDDIAKNPAISPDGAILACAGLPFTPPPPPTPKGTRRPLPKPYAGPAAIRLISVKTGKQYAECLPACGGQQKLILAFSPDGKLLASANDDGVIRLWKVPPPP